MRQVLVCLCLLLACAIAPAQSSSMSVVVGNSGSGCSNGLMTNGQVSTGQIDFTYDQATHLLTVTLTNTSPVFSGMKTPLLTRAYFNLPQGGAITSMQLMSQNTAAGALNWNFSYDTDLSNGSSLSAACMGDFGALLKVPNGINYGLAPLGGSNFSTQNYVFGPATFTILVTGPAAGNLTAGAFARSLSTGTDRTNAVMHFQGGGTDGGVSGWIGNAEGCSAGGWIVGEPRIDSTVYFVETAADGCYGCIIASIFPGPTTAYNITIPVGTPYEVVASALFPNQTAANNAITPIYVPNIPALVGYTFYCCVVTVDVITQQDFSISDQFRLTVLPHL